VGSSHDEKRGDQLLVKEIKRAPPLWKSCSQGILLVRYGKRYERDVAWQRFEKSGGRLGVVRMTLI
jgi:hypothetical protein